jgi:glycerol-3-phosphate dehydrogenase
VLVIGGGITGAGVARDAALRGLTVALMEKDDFSGGTSSRSSRLIHGGVRYLEHGDFRLVFEASAERRRLLRLAPHLVRPLPFLWPVYRNARLSRWKLSAGLTLYDLLSLFRNTQSHRRLSRTEVARAEPALSDEGLLGGARYYDAWTSDMRLTLAVVLDAENAGATIVNHAPVTALAIEGGNVVGAIVTDAETGAELPVRARVVINAAGPWSNGIRSLEQPVEKATVRGSRGSHILLPRDRIGNRDAVTILSPTDMRVMFVLPAGVHALIDTTDEYTDASPDQIRATEADVRYLLDGVNAHFPAARLTRADVVAAWSGIRPLLPATGDNPLGASREHAITVSPGGLVTIAGGKLTTFRVMAEQTVAVALRRLGRGADASPTLTRALPGGDVDVERAEDEAARVTGESDVARHLVAIHGSRWREVWDVISGADGRERLDAGLPYLAGEVRLAAMREHARTIGDVLVRRIPLAFETRDNARSIAPRVADILATVLGWSREQRARELVRYDEEVSRIFGVDRSG